MKKKFLLCISFFAALQSSASDLKIRNMEFRYEPGRSSPCIVFSLSWKNAWNNKKNFDAAWIFPKINEQYRSERPMLVKEGGVEFIDTANSSALQFEIPKDRGGVFIFAGKNFRGNIECRIKLYLDPASFSSVDLREVTYARVYGIEMVYIPAESFYEGDQDTTAFRFAAAYDPKTKSALRIDSEKEIKIGLENDLFYDAGSTPQYKGDQKGPIPADYPKGYKAFYIMKYEISQGQYADFLNSIYAQHGAMRANIGGKEYYPGRGTIVLKENTYIAGKPGEPLNFVSWDDGCAFADWACLRPVSELEFVKAARGPGRPVPGDYPWGSSSKEKLKRYFNESGELVFSDSLNESQLTDENKEEFGASYYWVMDMASGYWERVVSYGHPTGRNFKGTNGDGRLSSFGDASNEDWPKNNTGGVGYKGGGYYTPNIRSGIVNPNCPVSYRPFAAWAEGPRSIAYGFRCARTIE